MKKQIIERIHCLRMQMKKYHISYYLIPSSDYHNSEYVGEYFKIREYFSGFTGSNGTLLVSKDHAGLWTDGRYFVQAKHELEGSGIVLYCMGEKGVPTIAEYLKDNMQDGDVLGFDGRVCSKSYVDAILHFCAPKKWKLSYKRDLAGDLYQDRPRCSCKPVLMLPEEYCGDSVENKLASVKKQMEECGAKYLWISKLDDIMWLYNIRGEDVECNPVALSHTLITPDQNILFLQAGAVSSKDLPYFEKNNITIESYERVISYLEHFPFDGEVMLDEYETSYRIYRCIHMHAKIIFTRNPTELLKAVKSKKEIALLRTYYQKDSAVVCRFLYWMATCGASDEVSAGKHMDDLRAGIDGFMGLSFPTICAYRENAAMMHYEAGKNGNKQLEKSGMLLVDSGGQYLGATTDVTRTFALGDTTWEEKKFFTLVAAGMLRLMNARFLYGCTGRNLDILARGTLWNENVDYKCGTGHGVGCFLNVHEGPQAIRWKYTKGASETVLEEGMLVTDEPGVYFENRFGIRIENVLLVQKGVENKDGIFLYFEPLTYVPIDRRLILPEFLNEQDIYALNDYHDKVWKVISPYLTDEENVWLWEQTRPIICENPHPEKQRI